MNDFQMNFNINYNNEFYTINFHGIDLFIKEYIIILKEGNIIGSIQLLSISLPNLPLKVGYGGTLQNYPYIYLHFLQILLSFFRCFH